MRDRWTPITFAPAIPVPHLLTFVAVFPSPNDENQCIKRSREIGVHSQLSTTSNGTTVYTKGSNVKKRSSETRILPPLSSADPPVEP